MWQKPKKAENDRLKQAQGTISAGGSYRRYSMNQSGKIQQYIEKHKRKTLNGAKLVKGFCGAPNRIRTCGLLIRSQTLYPAELWVQSSFFIPVTWNENDYTANCGECQYFFEKYFPFSCLAPETPNFCKNQSDFWEMSDGGERAKGRWIFFLFKQEKSVENREKVRWKRMGGKEMKHQMFPKEKLWIKCVIHS